MSYDYDALYRETPDALGAPSQVFVDFFAHQSGKALRVLDIGCGQGRDAIFVARDGHSVVGVDQSPKGIRDLVAAAEQEGLAIQGIVADLVDFNPDAIFDVLLVDRTLHMLDEEPRLLVLARLIECVAQGGWALIEDERSNITGFKSVFAASDTDWTIETETRGTLFLRRA